MDLQSQAAKQQIYLYDFIKHVLGQGPMHLKYFKMHAFY